MTVVEKDFAVQTICGIADEVKVEITIERVVTNEVVKEVPVQTEVTDVRFATDHAAGPRGKALQ